MTQERPLLWLVDLADLRAQVREAVQCHFEGAERPKMVRLHFVREEVIAV